jgi:SpoVK/Ycf46/Vps4 family AAA+-type ATPase
MKSNTWLSLGWAGEAAGRQSRAGAAMSAAEEDDGDPDEGSPLPESTRVLLTYMEGMHDQSSSDDSSEEEVASHCESQCDNKVPKNVRFRDDNDGDQQEVPLNTTTSHWDKLQGIKVPKQILKNIFYMSKKYPTLVKAKRSILLFGPPGRYGIRCNI